MRVAIAQGSPRTTAAMATISVAVLVVVVVLVVHPLHLVRMGRGIVTVGGQKVSVLVADTPQRRSWGLQGSTPLPDGQGMLFVYDPPCAATFELNAVPFALDVVFVGPDLRVSRVGPLDAMHPVASSPGAVAYVLEVPTGWCGRHGIAVGTAVSVPTR